MVLSRLRVLRLRRINHEESSDGYNVEQVFVGEVGRRCGRCRVLPADGRADVGGADVDAQHAVHALVQSAEHALVSFAEHALVSFAEHTADAESSEQRRAAVAE
jgi:hypothetical protein